MRLRFGAEFPFIRNLSISDLELKHHLSAEPVNFRTLLSVVTSIVRHLQTTIFGTISCTGLVVNFRFPLTYGLSCFLPITVYSFLPQVMVVNFQTLSPFGIVALLETTKPSRRNPQRLVVSSVPLGLPFGTHQSPQLRNGFYILLPNSLVFFRH